MKKEIGLWIIVLLVLVASIVFGKQESMAIDFEASTGDQYIDFRDMASLKSLGTMTICAWIKAETANPYAHILDINARPVGVVDATGGYLFQFDDVGTKIRFIASWSTSSYGYAVWDSNTTITPGNDELICISYDSGASANDPVIYLNGVSVAITEIIAPSGTLIDSRVSNPNTRIGVGQGGSTETRFDGIIRRVLVFNRILTPAEILDMYTSRGASYPRNGLVFCPFLKGAAGLQAFDGATLGATNLIVDPCSGAVGTPAGSPVGVGETYLAR